MYLVEVVYGMKSYQNERREFEFNEEDKARDYYNKWLRKNPIKISFYQLLEEYSHFK